MLRPSYFFCVLGAFSCEDGEALAWPVKDADSLEPVQAGFRVEDCRGLGFRGIGA